MDGRNEEDRRIYERSARLVLLLALREAAPGARVRFEHSIGRGIYLNVTGVSLTASLVRRIEAKMREVVRRDLPIVKSRLTREQAIAFGDGGNDVTMLQYAGIGVAMGNACAEAKAAADYITEDVTHDGLAHALEHFGLI